MDEKKSRYFSFACVGAIFILCATLGYFCVWTHDDYLTVFADPLTILKGCLEFGNGRYLGNFIVNIALQVKIADAIIRGAFMTAIIALSAGLTGAFNARGLAVSTALFAGIGNLIFAEAIVWGHGFYNFVPPVAIILLCLCLLRKEYIDSALKYKKTAAVILAVLGFCGQLFSENTTCIALVISIAVFIFVLIKKKPKALALVYMISSAAGTFIMFALPAMTGVDHVLDDYRGVGVGAETLDGFISQFSGNLIRSLEALSVAFLCWGFLSFALFRLMKKTGPATGARRVGRIALKLVLAAYPLISLFYFFANSRSWRKRIPFTNIKLDDPALVLKYAVCAAFAVYLVCVLTVLLLHRKNFAGSGAAYWLILLIAAMSVGELLIITVMGPRCLFLTACILNVFVLVFLFGEGFADRRFCAVSALLAAAGMVALTVLLHSVWSVNNARVAYAEEQLAEGKEIIEIIRLPHGRWLHVPDQSAGYGYYFNYGEVKPIEDYTYITYEEYPGKNK